MKECESCRNNSRCKLKIQNSTGYCPFVYPTHIEEYKKGYADGYAKALDEFAEAIKESQQAYIWCCTDSPAEMCDGNCEICWIKFRKDIDEIAEQLKGGVK